MRFLRFLVLSSFVIIQTSYGLSLETVAVAALDRALPGKFFLEIRHFNGPKFIKIEQSDHCRYLPSRNVIQLTPGLFTKLPSAWGSNEWSQFYNELFHAWWDEVFSKETKYEKERDALRLHLPTYRISGDAPLAQEEALSETVAAVILLFAGGAKIEHLVYRHNWTVEPAGHSDDQAKLSAASEFLYPSLDEYRMVLGWLFGARAAQVDLTTTR